MKKLLDVTASPMATPVGIVVVALLTLTFWVAGGRAQGPGPTPDPNCTVCHKRTPPELTFPCNSLEYRRHLDHGDSMGSCPVTPVGNQ